MEESCLSYTETILVPSFLAGVIKVVVNDARQDGEREGGVAVRGGRLGSGT